MSSGVSQGQTRTATDAPAGQTKAPGSMRGLWVTLIRVAIIGGFLILWEIASGR